jgi:hypothetical protein
MRSSLKLIVCWMNGSVATESKTIAAPIEVNDLYSLENSRLFFQGSYNPFLSHNNIKLPLVPLLASSKVAKSLNGRGCLENLFCLVSKTGRGITCRL